MSTVLIIEQVIDGGNRHLATVADESILIGREPKPSGIAIPSFAISGTHGQFLRYGYIWFYRDLGSTNGSWFNEKQLAAGELHLVKHGDYILLANTILKLTLEFDASEVSEEERNSPALIAFVNKQYHGLLPLYPFLKYAEFGGENSSIPLSSKFSSDNLFCIHSGAAGSQLETREMTDALIINGQQHSGIVALQDRNEIKCGELLMIYSGGFHEGFLSDSVTMTGTYVDASAGLSGRPSKEVRMSSGFGVMPSDDETGRFSAPRKTVGILGNNAVKKTRSIEDIVIFIIAGILIAGVFVLLLWFMITQFMK